MKHQTLRRTLLAMAISAASMHALAIGPMTYDVTGRTSSIVQTGNIAGFTLTGSANINEDFLQLSQVAINGNVVNEASLTGNADQLNGLVVEGDGGIEGMPAIFNGSLINNGSVIINGLGANGVLLENTQMRGSILNNGTITVVGGFDPIEGDGASGIKLWNTYAAADIRNDGTINVSGERGKGLFIENSYLAGNLIVGPAGNINVSGIGADGAYIFNTTTGSIINYGTIIADGAGSNGIDLDQVSNRSLVNAGTIVAQGEGSTGLFIDGITLVQNGDFSLAQHGIINTGTIKGDHAGIEVVGDLQGASMPLYIHMNGGLLSGGNAAILGHGQDINLDWNAGTIQGDLVNIGDVNVNGYTVFDGSKISGNGHRTVSVNDGGNLNFEQASTTITDDLLVAQNGTIRLLVTPETNPTQAILNVGGTATFDAGSTISLEARPIDFAPNSAGTNYLIVDAGTLVNNGVAVNSNSYLLELKSFEVVDNKLVAKLAMKDYEEIHEIIKQSGADSNGQAAFMPLVSVLSKMDQNDPVFKAMVNASPEQRAELAKQLQPDVNGGSTQAALGGQSTIVTAVTGRTDSLRTSESTGDMLAETGVWFQVLNNDSNQDRRDGIDGYSADTTGFTLGADGKLNSQWTVGLAYTYLTSDVKTDSGNKTDVDGHSLTGYASFALDNWFADSSLTYSKNSNDSKRYVLGTEAKGSYDSDMLGLALEGGYSFALAPSFALEPLAAVRYAVVNIDSYDEKGSSAALSVGSQRYEVAEAGLGLRAKGNFTVGNGVFKPEAKVIAYHDFIGDQASTSSTYLLGGSAFTTTGASPERDTYQAGVGGTYELGNLSFGLTYDYTAKSGFDSDTFTGKVRWDF